MIWERDIIIEGTAYPVTLSDETEALLAAKAAGRVVVGLLLKRKRPAKQGKDIVSEFKPIPSFAGVKYLLEIPDSATPLGDPCSASLDGSCSAPLDGPCSASLDGLEPDSVSLFLERVVRREKGLPWIIGESSRLLIREFTLADLPQVIPEPADREDDHIFYTPEKLAAYIKKQYGFFEYGIWAVVRKEDGRLLGKAGVTAYAPANAPTGASTSTPTDAQSNNQPSASLDNQTSASHAPTETYIWNPTGQPTAFSEDSISNDHSPSTPLDGSAPALSPEDSLELGYHIFTHYRRQGYAREACQIILDYLREEYDVPRSVSLYAKTETANAASVHLLRRLGFRPL